MIHNSNKFDDVKEAAKGRWIEILPALAGINPEHLDGNHYPCPECAGTDRFNADRASFDETGSVYCNQCSLSGDGFHALQEINRWDFAECVRRVGQLLACEAMSVAQPKTGKSAMQKRGMPYPDALSKVLRGIRSKLPHGVTVPDIPNRTESYQNRGGSIVGVILRWDRSDGTKEIRPLSMTTTGWSLSAMSAPRPLFRLPDVTESDTVFIAEGEKAAEALVSLGLVGSTSAGGCNAPNKTDWTPLAGKTVVIIPDHDSPGRKYRDTVSALIHEQAPGAIVYTADLSEIWPEILEKADVFDWAEHFDTQPPEWLREQLASITKLVTVHAKTPVKQPAKDKPRMARLKLTNANDVAEEQLSWLWDNRFLFGHINIVAGDPGLGKSLIAVDIAARVSAGMDWPDGSACEAGKVIYSTTEDGYADTVKPRLSAANANHENIVFLEGVEHPDGEGPMFLDEHLVMLDWHLDQTPGVKLLILDTLQSFVGEKVNTNNNSSSRRVMTPLKRLAEKHRVAILCIEHLTKSVTTKRDNATYRIQGSIAFTGAARSVWIVCKDPDDPDKRVLQASKTNLAPDNEGLGLSFTVAGPTGRPAIQWDETNISTPISELLSNEETTGNDEAASEFQRACQFLRSVLTEPKLQSEIRAGYKAEMLSDATIRRAKKHLEIESQQKDRQWLWTPSEAMLAGIQASNCFEPLADERLNS